jgi:hypothetical protein
MCSDPILLPIATRVNQQVSANSWKKILGCSYVCSTGVTRVNERSGGSMLWLVIVLAMTGVGTVAGFVLAKQASTWCPGCGRTAAGFAPRPFALHAFDGAESDDDIIADGPLLAWGMTLPDGSAVTVDWRNGPSSGVTLSANPDQAARLHDADVVWLPWPTRIRA